MVFEFGVQVLCFVIEWVGLVLVDVDQVNFGCVLFVGIGQVLVCQVIFVVGCLQLIGVVIVNKVCGFGMCIVMMVVNDLCCGDFDIVVVGGMESMLNVFYFMLEVCQGLCFGEKKLIDFIVYDGFWDVYGDKYMGNCVEICVVYYFFSCEEQDVFVEESY